MPINRSPEKNPIKQWKNGNNRYLLREDGIRIEWICTHEIGHTVALLQKVPAKDRRIWFIHGCDGCCVPKIKNKEI